MRTGKLLGRTKILIPYFDTEGDRHYMMIVLDGTIYASKMYAGIRQFVRDNFNTEVDKDWLENVPLIVNEHDQEVKVSEEEKNKLVEAWIDWMELKDDTTESGSDTGSEGQDAAQAGESMRPVSDQSGPGGH